MICRRFFGTVLFASIAAACAGTPPRAIEDESSTTDEVTEGADLGSPRARIWRQRAMLNACSGWNIDEDFSSGRYNAHRYAITLQAGSTAVIQLARQDGRYQPAVVVTLPGKGRVFDGEHAKDANGLKSVPSESGRTGAVASVALTTSDDRDLYVYVTSWDAVDQRYALSLPTSATYMLSIEERCAPPPAPATGGGWQGVYSGLDLSGSHIPRAGISNATLRASLGVSVEPIGAVVSLSGHAFVRGKVSSFGGPNDTGVTASETGSVTGERLRSLNTPLHPTKAQIAASPGKFYYAAMRWDYSGNGTGWWARQRLVVVSPSTGRAVVVRPVDWGPNTRTGRLIDLAPQTLADLGITTDDTVLVAFAMPGAALGVK